MNILVDVGGTKIRIAGSRGENRFDEPRIVATPQSYDAAIETIITNARELAAGESIEAVAIGVPATLSRDKRIVLGGALHIPEWKNKAFADDIERALQTSVHADNDTALVGLGEAHFGAGKEVSLFVYVTISTGVNGVRIVDGAIDRSMFGFSIGHQFLSIEGEGRTWEQMVSGSATEKRFGKHPRELGADHAVWEELAQTAAFGLHNSIMHWSPERIVVGGSMTNEIGISIDRIAFHLKRISSTVGGSVEIVHAKLGDVGGLWGGLTLLKQRRSSHQ